MISQFAEARRSQQIEQLTKDRKHQHAHQMMEWKKRYLEKQNETTRRAHEDSLKHLQVIFQGSKLVPRNRTLDCTTPAEFATSANRVWLDCVSKNEE